jgi:tyrosinase
MTATVAAVTAKRYVSKPLNLDNLSRDFTRADIEFHGVDHSEASYEARVFLNNPDADETTERTAERGYVGAFHIFGHGGCFGDEGHCEVGEPRRPYDPRPEHPLAPTVKVVIATDAIRRALGAGKEATITVVPIVTGGTEKCDFENVLKFERLRIVTYL